MAMATAIDTTMAILIGMVIPMDITIDTPTDTPHLHTGEIIIMGGIITNQGIDPVIRGEIKG